MVEYKLVQGQLREMCIRRGWVQPAPGDQVELSWAREGWGGVHGCITKPAPTTAERCRQQGDGFINDYD